MSYGKLGDISRRANDTQAATSFYQMARAIAAKLAAQDALNVSYSLALLEFEFRLSELANDQAGAMAAKGRLRALIASGVSLGPHKDWMTELLTYGD
ncbi:MAG: hypothetical protein DCF16_08195 [Alphaproteobacteria bacterium]|nr:MAG: hypothetical protein DCF16_08195 [Alphaproteobacteria bacterium]